MWWISKNWTTWKYTTPPVFLKINMKGEQIQQKQYQKWILEQKRHSILKTCSKIRKFEIFIFSCDIFMSSSFLKFITSKCNENFFLIDSLLCIMVFLGVEFEFEVEIIEFNLLHGFSKMVIFIIFNSSGILRKFLEISWPNSHFWKVQKISFQKNIGLLCWKWILSEIWTYSFEN